MNGVARFFAFTLALVASISLVAIEKHLALASNALALMALSQPAPRRGAPGVQNASLTTSRGHARKVDTVIDGGDAEKAPRFEAGGLELPDGSKLVVVKDREAHTIIYIVRDANGTAVATAHIPREAFTSCEDGSLSLDDSGLRSARVEAR